MSSSYYGQYTEMDKPDGYLWLVDEYKKLQQQIERLQEQLNEANEVIAHYAEKNGYMKAIKYLNKWGVK